MTTAIYTALALLASALLTLGWRAYQNHVEISRLKRNGYRRVACRRLSERGYIEQDFARCLAELFVLVLLLISLFGWLSHSSPQ